MQEMFVHIRNTANYSWKELEKPWRGVWDCTGAEQRNGRVSPGGENQTRLRHGLWVLRGRQMNQAWREVHGWEK